ncbi:MAG: crossover junction endodeoxyribonuclease RuvC [Planctomycetes bacterium]|nr:crossover junction endodeoxyribonuclease RuvC [Planctomycetota bacterium]
MNSSQTRPRRVLGIDPGLANVGWGVVDLSGSRLLLVEHSAIHSTTAEPHADRLREIYRGLTAVIERLRPESIAVEEVFHGKSAKSALLAGEGRGVCILAGAMAGKRIAEYPSATIKMAVTGNGRAAKVQVQAMVSRLLGLPAPPRPHDAADALAVAITHLLRGERRLQVDVSARRGRVELL